MIAQLAVFTTTWMPERCLKSYIEFGKSLPEYPIYTSVSDVVAASLCDMDQNGLHRKVCLGRECNECDVCLLQFHVQWGKSEYVDVRTKRETRKS